jgi:HNH endonuclease/NUMOD4 motif
LKNTTRYIDVIQDIVWNYNHTEHSTIHTSPSEAIVNLRTYQETPKDLYKKYKENELKVGDKVRLIQVSKFKKISDPTWSHQIYEIEQKIGFRYKLKGNKTLYARYHLKKVSKPSEIEQGYFKELQETKKEQKKEKQMKKIGIENKDTTEILIEPKVSKRDKFVIYYNKIKFADMITLKQEFHKKDILNKFDSNLIQKELIDILITDMIKKDIQNMTLFEIRTKLTELYGKKPRRRPISRLKEALIRLLKEQVINSESRVKEKIKPIPGFPGYKISDRGNVYHHDKKLSPFIDTSGYLQVKLYNVNNGIQQKFLVHRLVANAFIKKKYGYEEVDHIDRNKKNNNVSNLRWSNRSENNLNK